MAIDYTKSDEARQILKVCSAGHRGFAVSPIFLPPGTNKETVRVLRKSFMDTLGDPEFSAR
jgi:hypothetical protein